MKRFLPILPITATILLVSALHFLTPVESFVLHQIYQRLYYIPIIVASLLYGWRGGLGAALLASVSYVPHIAMRWQNQNYDYALNQYAEIALFFVIGAVTGWLGDQKRRESERAERINTELQNAYAELRQTVGQLLQAERLSSLAEIASGVVHEVRNPLGAIKGAVEILEDELAENSPRREFARIAKTEVERIDKLVQEFFHFARTKKPDLRPADMNELVKAVEIVLENQTVRNNVRLKADLDRNLPPVAVDAEQIKQVLLNLAINALEAMPEGGELVFRTYQRGARLHVEIEDTGGGIAPSVKAKIFDPFFTTKEKGLGLGLSVVYKIVGQHNGRLEFFDTPNGTRAVLTFAMDGSLTKRQPTSEI